MTPGEHVTVTATKEPVAIWSGEHNAWWRANRSGYCTDPVAAGLYSLADAISATHHVGPEKRISIINAPEIAVRLCARDAVIKAAQGIIHAKGPMHVLEGMPTLRDAVKAMEALDKQS